MAIATQDPVLAWRRLATLALSFSPSTQAALAALKSYLVQQGGNPKLQIVVFDELSDTDVVIADAACTLYGIVLHKDTTTKTYSKFTNNASTGSDATADMAIMSSVIGDHAITFPKGEAWSTGITAQGTTTVNGGTGSGTNGCKGFAIIGDA
jgi:hypothetical protein